MKIDLSGKTAIVTGSTKGIGFATAKGLARCGAKVVISGRSDESVNHAIAALKDELPDIDVSGVTADLSSGEGCSRLIFKAPECDILVNNVGIFQNQDFFEIPDTEWQRFFDTNIMSAVRLSRHYALQMRDKGWGRLIFLSSESAANIPVEMIHYGMTKTALLGLSRGMAKLLAGSGVTANAVLPGPTMSEGVEDMIASMAQEKGLSKEEAGAIFVKENRPSSVIQRMASVEEVANMIVYACSEQASATSGSALRVDGGVIDFIM